MKNARMTGLQVSSTALLALLSACVGDIQPRPTSKPDLRVVFQAAYSKDGRFTVTEDREGWLGVGLTGAIAGDDPVSLGLKLHRSLVDTHRALLPGAEVPATLVQLNDRFLAQYAPGSKRLVSASPAPVTAPAAAAIAHGAGITKPLRPADWFYREFCKWRNDSGFESVPVQCWYMSPDQERLCYWVDWNPNDGTEAFPAAFAKNDAPLARASLWGRRVTLTVEAHDWALAVLSRESQEVCFDYEGGWGDFGLTKSWGQFQN